MRCFAFNNLFTFSISVSLTEAGVEKIFVAQRVGTKLVSTEDALDNAMIEAAGLMADMLQARKDLNLSVISGDKAHAKIVQAMALMAEARSAMVEAHQELGEMKLRLGIRTKMVGIERDKDTTGSLKTARDLREVG